MDKYSPPQQLTDFLRANTALALAMEQPGFVEAMKQAADLMEAAYRAGRKLIFCGNGGSASSASHFAQDFNKGYTDVGLPAFRSLALTDSVANITALGNDDQFDQVFARQIEQWGDKGDVLIALSGSGNSPNILKAVEAAKQKGIQVIGLTGSREGSKLPKMNDVSLSTPTPHMQHIENAHVVVLHGLYLEVLGRLIVDQAYGRSQKLGAPAPTPTPGVGVVAANPGHPDSSRVVEDRERPAGGRGVEWCPLCGTLDASDRPLERRHLG